MIIFDGGLFEGLCVLSYILMVNFMSIFMKFLWDGCVLYIIGKFFVGLFGVGYICNGLVFLVIGVYLFEEYFIGGYDKF